MAEIPAIDEIVELYRDVIGHYDPERSGITVHVSFYPYIGINQTIRVRDGQIYVRIAEICWEMPIEIHKALAYVLVAKLFRRRVPKRARELYTNYISSPEMRERATASRRERGRKVITGTSGAIYDLEELFSDLNAKYFWGTLRKPTLTWSAKPTFRILGHFDSHHDTIVISRSLDSTDVPRLVIEYVMYHEMLHVFHPTVHHNGRRYNHTPEFRRDEERFENFEEADRWIEQNARKLKRKVTKGKSILRRIVR
ncbi:MAG: SprT-like domain-containing protein [Acidobacteria bacterium]|nr:SprT-like domain-containing protein [Acidobacteriota bacterium]